MQVIWGQVSHVTSPIKSLRGILELLILQLKWYNLNSDTRSIVIHYWHVSLRYHLFFTVWRHRWSHRGLLGYQHFSSITFDQIKIQSRERNHCAGTERASRPICNLIPLAQSMTLGGVTWPWPRNNLDFGLYQTKSLAFDAVWWENCDAACILALWPLLAELRAINQTQPLDLGNWPDLWGHRLIWNNFVTKRCFS